MAGTGKLRATECDTEILDVCMKLSAIKADHMKPAAFVRYIAKGIEAGRTICLVRYDKAGLLGCAVLTWQQSVADASSLWIDFAWARPGTDAADAGMKTIEELARLMGARTIRIEAKRGWGAYTRKYGFQEAARIMKKELTNGQ